MLLRLLKSAALAALVSVATALLIVLLYAASIWIWMWLHVNRSESGITAVAGGVPSVIALVPIVSLPLSFWYFWRRSKP